ncbi:ead/Ea22-like family protein [Escherichia coli]|uniref:ead/Ea22-like family protein n=1 Tax=Escherichia coli TaxID=562 RepID=UPI000A1885BD|nr:ead/Ea22-like family protein [Escherichia coli]OSL93535.1 putative bacteriophage protein [Escherichia coli T426]
MTIDYQALREAAEKATCGEWSLEYGKGRFDGDDALIHREAAGYIPICRIEGAHPESGFDEDFQMEQQANAEFIAAANPAAVLTLLDELETAKKRITELEAEPVSQTYKLNELSGNPPVTPEGWISCSDRMPEDTKMLLAFSQGEIVAAYWNWVVNPIDYKKYRAFTYLSGNILDDVTHWMPLPEPPQEVNRG